MSGNEELKQQIKSQRSGKPEPIMGPMRTIDCNTDTTNVKVGNAFFTSLTNTITKRYSMTGDNSLGQAISTLAHEQKHRDNHIAGMANMPMSLEQYYKVCCHDEISANICELLHLRQEYIDAKTEEERAQIMEDNNPKNQDFSYYWKAVKEGKINPLTSDPLEFDKEMKFIATETQRMWMKTYAPIYDEAHTSMTKVFFASHNYSELAPSWENYEKALQIAYNIGGIDFSKYMKDITVYNDNILYADTLIMKNNKRKDARETIKTADGYTAKDWNKVKERASYNISSVQKNPKLSIEQQYRLAQHRAFAAGVIEWNVKFATEQEIREYVGSAFAYEAEEYSNLIKNDKKKAWDILESKIAQRIVEQNGSNVFNQGDEAEYQKELAKIYTVNGVDLRQFLDKDVESYVPENTPEEFENLPWYKRLENKIKETYTAVTGKIPQTAEDKYDRPKDFVYEQYTGAPKYPEWSPDKRVSEVQYVEIYDFRQPFLAEQRVGMEIKEIERQRNINETKMAQQMRKSEEKHKNQKITTSPQREVCGTDATAQNMVIAEYHRRKNNQK